MKIILAPMEGVIDYHMRSILTAVGGYDRCVTEFLRVTDHQQPKKVYKRLLPELDNKGATKSGIPVSLQLLGSDPEMMAQHANIGAELGAKIIDINFGCPSKIVNRKMGGSALLRDPHQIYHIVGAVRKSVPDSIPVTAKMRLGYDDQSLSIDNALAIESAGASEIVVHARTKADGYKHPARWDSLAPLSEALNIPLIANGDIITYEDYLQCKEISGCADVMLARGALINPLLAKKIKNHHTEEIGQMDWSEISGLILKLISNMEGYYPQKCIVMRLKQWLSMLQKHHSCARDLFKSVKKMVSTNEIQRMIEQYPIRASLK